MATIQIDPVQMHLAQGLDATRRIMAFVQRVAATRHVSTDDVVELTNMARSAEFSIKVLAGEVKRNQIPPAFRQGMNEDE